MKLIDLLVKELPKRGGWPERATHAWQDWDNEVRPGSKGFGFYTDELADNHRRRGECSNPEPGDDNCVTRAQYESALAASDGWIQWGGGECPVQTGLLVDVRYGDGTEEFALEANMPNKTRFRTAAAAWWRKDGHSGDIIAYRLHKPDINSRAKDDRLEQDLNECIGQDVDMPEWNGDGVPPVGIECEVKWTGGKWEKCEVLFVGTEKVVVEMRNREAAMSLCDVKFRPLRTEAEKARENACHEIASMIGRGTFFEDAERIYDAGYRKEVK